MELSTRLAAVAGMVTEGNKVADIGTDHGYVPIYLVEQGIIPSAIAMDINKGPILRAGDNIRIHNLESQIGTRQSDGLAKLNPFEADSVIIAGMGGALTVKILTEGKEVLQSVRELILQPQSELEKVRIFLREQQYEILKEEMVLDAGKFYTVMKVVKGSPVFEKRIYDLYGKHLLEAQHPVLYQFLTKEKGIYEQLKEKLTLAGTAESRQRLAEIDSILRCLEEAISCYSCH